MASRRLADTPAPARRRQAQPSLPPPPTIRAASARDLLLHSWPGRLFIVAAALKLLVALVRLVGDLPTFLASSAAPRRSAWRSRSASSSRGWFPAVQRRLLWRVRRKLILSYIFIGVVPALLIIGFFLLGACVRRRNVSAYLFKDGYDDIVEQRRSCWPRPPRAEIGRVAADRRTRRVDRVQRNGSASLRYPTLSMVFIPAVGEAAAGVSRGRVGAPARPVSRRRCAGLGRDEPTGSPGTIARAAAGCAGRAPSWSSARSRAGRSPADRRIGCVDRRSADRRRRCSTGCTSAPACKAGDRALASGDADAASAVDAGIDRTPAAATVRRCSAAASRFFDVVRLGRRATRAARPSR